MSKFDPEKDAFWRLVLAEQADSKLSIRQFCQQEGISEASFYDWRRTIGKRNQQAASVVPVKVIGNSKSKRKENVIDRVDAPSDQDGNQQPIEILTPNGFTVRVSESNSTHAISRVLQATSDLLVESC